MPYKIVKKGGKWHVVNTETGQDKGGSDSKEKAVGHMRLLYGVKHGMEPRPKK